MLNHPCIFAINPLDHSEWSFGWILEFSWSMFYWEFLQLCSSGRFLYNFHFLLRLSSWQYWQPHWLSSPPPPIISTNTWKLTQGAWGSCFFWFTVSEGLPPLLLGCGEASCHSRKACSTQIWSCERFSEFIENRVEKMLSLSAISLHTKMALLYRT